MLVRVAMLMLMMTVMMATMMMTRMRRRRGRRSRSRRRRRRRSVRRGHRHHHPHHHHDEVIASLCAIRKHHSPSTLLGEGAVSAGSCRRESAVAGLLYGCGSSICIICPKTLFLLRPLSYCRGGGRVGRSAYSNLDTLERPELYEHWA